MQELKAEEDLIGWLEDLNLILLFQENLFNDMVKLQIQELVKLNLLVDAKST